MTFLVWILMTSLNTRNRADRCIVIKKLWGYPFGTRKHVVMSFIPFFTFFLLRRSHVNRSPHGTYSMTRNISFSSVQHPTMDTTFLCEPNSFICSISNVNSSLCASDGSSKDKWIKWCRPFLIILLFIIINILLLFFAVSVLLIQC